MNDLITDLLLIEGDHQSLLPYLWQLLLWTRRSTESQVILGSELPEVAQVRVRRKLVGDTGSVRVVSGQWLSKSPEWSPVSVFRGVLRVERNVVFVLYPSPSKQRSLRSSPLRVVGQSEALIIRTSPFINLRWEPLLYERKNYRGLINKGTLLLSYQQSQRQTRTPNERREVVPSLRFRWNERPFHETKEWLRKEDFLVTRWNRVSGRRDVGRVREYV